MSQQTGAGVWLGEIRYRTVQITVQAQGDVGTIKQAIIRHVFSGMITSIYGRNTGHPSAFILARHQSGDQRQQPLADITPQPEPLLLTSLAPRMFGGRRIPHNILATFFPARTCP